MKDIKDKPDQISMLLDNLVRNVIPKMNEELIRDFNEANSKKS